MAARGTGREEVPPLTDVPVDAILARLEALWPDVSNLPPQRPIVLARAVADRRRPVVGAVHTRAVSPSPALRLRDVVAGYPTDTVTRAEHDVRGLDWAGAHLIAVWCRADAVVDAEPPPLTDAQVDAVLHRLQDQVQ